MYRTALAALATVAAFAAPAHAFEERGLCSTYSIVSDVLYDDGLRAISISASTGGEGMVVFGNRAGTSIAYVEVSGSVADPSTRACILHSGTNYGFTTFGEEVAATH